MEVVEVLREHGDAAGREVEVRDEVVGGVGPVEGSAASAAEAGQAGHLAHERNVRLRVVAVEGGGVGRLAIADGDSVHGGYLLACLRSALTLRRGAQGNLPADPTIMPSNRAQRQCPPGASRLMPLTCRGASYSRVKPIGVPSSTVRLTVQRRSWEIFTASGSSSRALSPSAPSGNLRVKVTAMSVSRLARCSSLILVPATVTRNESGSARREVSTSTSIAVQAPMAVSSSSTGVKVSSLPLPTLIVPPRSLLTV